VNLIISNWMESEAVARPPRNGEAFLPPYLQAGLSDQTDATGSGQACRVYLIVSNGMEAVARVLRDRNELLPPPLQIGLSA
jgi:hypothetical protein